MHATAFFTCLLLMTTVQLPASPEDSEPQVRVRFPSRATQTEAQPQYGNAAKLPVPKYGPTTDGSEKVSEPGRANMFLVEMRLIEFKPSASHRSPWSDTAEPIENVQDIWEMKRNAGFQVISAPKILVVAGQSARVEVASQGSYQYMRPGPDKSFELVETEPITLGINIEILVRMNQSSVEFKTLKISSTSMDGRMKVPGTDLPVGKPIVTTRVVETSTSVDLDQPRMMKLPTSAGKSGALLYRVSRPKPTKGKAWPSPVSQSAH